MSDVGPLRGAFLSEQGTGRKMMSTLTLERVSIMVKLDFSI